MMKVVRKFKASLIFIFLIIQTLDFPDYLLQFPWVWIIKVGLTVSWLPSEQDASPLQGYAQHYQCIKKVADIHFNFWVERNTVRVERFDQEHNTLTQARGRTCHGLLWSGVQCNKAIRPPERVRDKQRDEFQVFFLSPGPSGCSKPTKGCGICIVMYEFWWRLWM